MTALGKHDLLIAMAHSFQGEKRDVMFLSFAMDPASHLVTLRFLNRPDVFNVSITRIRIEQRFYVSCDVLPGRAQTQSPAVYEMVDGSVEIYRGRRGDGSSLT